MFELDPYRKLPDPGETALIEVRPSVAVIGAGMSGLIAARLLAERGYPVTVFDKGMRPGGRASTRDNGPFAFDHGCQYFTARDKRFKQYVEAWKEQGIVSEWKARRASCVNAGVNLVQDDVERYVGVPGMRSVSQHLALHMDIREGVEITSLERDDTGWRLLAKDEIDERFELVVVSAPAPQSARLLAPVPKLAEMAAGVSMVPCWCVMAAFEYDLDVPFDATYFSNSPLVWAANNSSKPGRSQNTECWVLQASPSWSVEHLEEDPETVATILASVFFKETGLEPVKPAMIKAHRWRYASPAEALQKECLWDMDNWIGACGDWCFSARMEGAFLSGLSLAERIFDDRPRSRQFVRD